MHATHYEPWIEKTPGYSLNSNATKLRKFASSMPLLLLLLLHTFLSLGPLSSVLYAITTLNSVKGSAKD
jgi:hypothetical protein